MNTTTRTAITTAATWVASASSNITTSLGAAWTWLAAAAGAFGVIPPAAATGTPGDFSVGTYDITKIDRLFFAVGSGVDGINTSDTRPHISPVADSIAGMSFYVPDGSNFYFNRGSDNILSFNSSLGVIINEKFTAAMGVTVGGGTPSTNGEIGRNSDEDLVFRGKNKNYTLSQLASGGGGGGGGGGGETVTANQFIIKNSSDYASASAFILDTDFGSERGCIGIRCNTAVSQASDNTKVYLYIKSNLDWFGFTMSARLSSTRTLVGTAYGTSTTKRRIKYTTSDNQRTTESLVGTVEGRLFAHQESDDANDGSFGIYSSGLRYVDYGSATEIDATDDSGTTVTLLDTIPTTQLSRASLNNSALDSAYGSAEGTMGFNRNTNDLFIKVNGYWWYKELVVQP